MKTYKCNRCNKTSAYRSSLICSRCDFSSQNKASANNNALISIVSDSRDYPSGSSSGSSSYNGGSSYGSCDGGSDDR